MFEIGLCMLSVESEFMFHFMFCFSLGLYIMLRIDVNNVNITLKHGSRSHNDNCTKLKVIDENVIDQLPI